MGIYELRDIAPAGQADHDPESRRLVNDEAPNISLNTSSFAPSSGELRAMAFVALILQSGVLVFDGIVEYRLRLNKRNLKYAFPLTIVGTLGLVAGIFICAYVIEASTVEHTWSLDKDLHMLWIQRGQKVNDQSFKSYGIYAAKDRKEVRTSRPLKNKRDLRPWTDIGVILSISGT